MKRLLSTLLITVFLMGLLLGSYLYVFTQKPYGTKTTELHIARGTPLDVIINKLASEGIISSAPLFRIYLVVQGVADQVRAGDYIFEAQTSPKEVVRQLLHGDFKIYRITIPEGWTMQQIADSLERKGLVSSDSFLSLCRDPEWISTLGLAVKSLEGFLFPSTYETYYPEGPSSLIEMMVKEFQKVYTPEMSLRAKGMGLSLPEVVTLASIIEKETGKKEEHPLIASIFHNRRTRGMPLQSDPTVIYGLKDFNGNLTRRHLETYTPYNTYVIAGLPPGPIANPGKAALLAVLYPAETNYLYFVSRNDGTHDFSRTLSEHQAKVYKYQIAND